jgi:glycyl-tRNA synthetase alpha chain
MYIQKKESIFDILWVGDVTYGDVYHQNEVDYSTYNFEASNAEMLFALFEMYEKEAMAVLEKGLVQPAYDYVLKCSHSFNLLDARGAISVTERTGYITRIRNMARACALGFIQKRGSLGFPLIKDEAKRRQAVLEFNQRGGGQE